MKKIFTLAAVAMMAAGMYAQQGYTLDLNNPTNPETIEFGDNGAWTGTYNDQDYQFLEFTPFAFSHLISGSSWGGTYWDGFTVCKSGETSASWVNSAAGGGLMLSDAEVMPEQGDVAQTNADAPYLVCYWASFMEGTAQVMFNDGKQYAVKGMYVTNNATTYNECLNGGGVARALNQEGDYLKLIATGYDANGEVTGTTEFVLANCENGVQNVVSQWIWWDMSSLGTVDHINFTMASTDVGDWGINTSTYFCMDKLQVVESPSSAVDNNLAVKTVAATQYVNLAGQTSNRPFDGMNVVVTRYSDGTTTTSKVVF